MSTSPSSIDEVEEPDPWSIADEKFDRIYPLKLRKLSALHWTPVRVAAEAARMLVTKPGTRVLDVGCGPAKFCLVAAALVEGHFTGIEQRKNLVLAGRAAAGRLRLRNVQIRHGNIVETNFSEYDAFYIYNPFEENMARAHKIDTAVPLSPFLFKRYNHFVASQLGPLPLGTRVVTYAGYADEIPGCYECESARFRDDLKLWIKTRSYDPALDQLGLSGSRSYRGPHGWVAPRRRP